MALLLFTDGLGNGTFSGSIAETVLNGFEPNAGGDITAPTLSSPTSAATGQTSCSGTVSTDEGNGTLYFVVTQNVTSPSVAQVQAGQDHTGAAADYANSQAVVASGVQNVTGGGLTASTQYWIHYQHQDAATNDSTVSTSADFTTSAAGSPAASEGQGIFGSFTNFGRMG